MKFLVIGFIECFFALTVVEIVFKPHGVQRLQVAGVIVGFISVLYLGIVGALYGDWLSAGASMIGTFAAIVVYWTVTGWPCLWPILSLIQASPPQTSPPPTEDDPNWSSYRL